MDKAKILTVNKDKAITETKNWRKYYKKSIAKKEKVREDDIFRGFRIPLDDFKDIIERIETYNNKLTKDDKRKVNSIRIYLAKSNPNTDDANDIHVFLIPVEGGKKMDVETNVPLPEYGSDLLIMGDEEELALESAIYDFSTPCPQQCDKESVLYTEKNLD